MISESEKNKILNLHKKKQQPFYLKEQDEDVETSDAVMKLNKAGFQSSIDLSRGDNKRNVWTKKGVDLILDDEQLQVDVMVNLDDSLENLIELVLSDFGSEIKMEFEVTNKILEDLTNDNRMRELFAEFTGMMRMNADLYLDIYDDLEMNKQEDLNPEISVYLNLARHWDRNKIGLNSLPILTNKKSSDLYKTIKSKVDDENIKNKLSEMINICNIIQNKL